MRPPNDVREKNNLAKQKPELAKSMHEKMLAWRKEVGAKIPGLITVMFSILEPGLSIPEHTGKLSGLFRYHLALEVPEKGDCFITIDRRHYYWKKGEGILFDDTFLHSVTNDSEEYRIVLFLDINKHKNYVTDTLNQFFLQLIKWSPMFRRAVRTGKMVMD